MVPDPGRSSVGDPAALLDSRAWRWRNSLWLVPVIALVGIATWASFLYIGLRSGTRKWQVAAAGYGVVTLVVLSDGAEGSPLPLLVWVGGIAHALVSNPEWLRWKAAHDAAPRWSGPVATAPVAPAVPAPPAPAPPPTSELVEPWRSLVAEAYAVGPRMMAARERATGAAVAPIERAVTEGRSAYGAAWRVAAHASDVARARRGIDPERVRARLVELEAMPSNDDVEAARASLRNQLATADRMGELLERLDGELHRLVAQLGEAAASAEELAHRPAGTTDARGPGLVPAVDGLVALRKALDVVDLSDVRQPH